MRKILVVIDMQNDFITGSLSSKEAQGIVPSVIEKIKAYDRENVFATMDTHYDNYLETQEGRLLPVKHCIKGTEGWLLDEKIASLISEENIIEKPTFGSTELVRRIQAIAEKQEIEVLLVGLCTDICVVSNALMLKAFLPEVPIAVDPSCCAGVSVEKHEAALETLRSCQVLIRTSC